MKILITGGAGFIGSNLAHWLIKNTEHKVICIDNYATGFFENMPEEADRVPCNIIQSVGSNPLNEVFENYKPDVCYHLAAYAAEARSNRIRVFNHINNTVGTANVINACINHRTKLVFTSSVAVYSGKAPFDENTTPNPIDEYGLSKYMSELSIKIAGEQQGLDWCIVRPRNVYGERQSLWDSARNVMGIWMNQILKGESITIFGDGSQTRAFTYIGDILQPLYNAAFVRKEIINLGSSAAYSVQTAADILCKQVIGKNIFPKYLPARHEVGEAWCLVEKSEKLLGYKDQTTLKDGLTKMWNWAKIQPQREQTPLPELEIL